MRRRFWRWVLRLAVALLLTAILAVGAALLWLRSSLPQLEGELRLPGIEGPVELLRDRYGVPTIRARSAADAAFGLGYAHAQDRFAQMELMRRGGSGRMSELVGSMALGFDRYTRGLGLMQQAESQAAALPPDLRRIAESYAAGVNAWLDARAGALPWELSVLFYEPEPWRVVDSMLWGRLMAFRLIGNWRAEATARTHGRAADAGADRGPLAASDGGRSRDPAGLSPDFSPRSWSARCCRAGREGETRRAMRCIGQAGRRTLPARERRPSGRVQAPARGGPTPPSIQAAALGAASRASTVGSAPLFGPLLADRTPGRDAGRDLGENSGLGSSGASNVWAVSEPAALANDPHLGFTIPNIWYLARIETPEGTLAGATTPGVPFMVLGHNGSIAWGFTTPYTDTADVVKHPEVVAVRRETLAVRWGDSVDLELRRTRNGVVVSDFSDALPEGWAVESPAFRDDDRTAQALGRLNEARDWPDFVAALRSFHSPQQNIVYADRAGRIGIVTPGRVPLRHGGFDVSAETKWLRLIPFDRLPRRVDPPSGRIVNANNRLVDETYPYYLGREWAAPYRALRIEALLNAGETHAAIQNDTVSLAARELLPYLLSAVPDVRLQAWDGDMDRRRPEPLIYMAWVREAMRAVFADELGPLFDAWWAYRPLVLRRALLDRPAWCDDTGTKAKETCKDRLTLAHRRAVAFLQERYGAETPPWGEVHRARFAHPVAGRIPLLRDLLDREIATSGGPTTLNRGSVNFRDERHPFRTATAPDTAPSTTSTTWTNPVSSRPSGSRATRSRPTTTILWNSGGTGTISPSIRQGRRPTVCCCDPYERFFCRHRSGRPAAGRAHRPHAVPSLGDAERDFRGRPLPEVREPAIHRLVQGPGRLCPPRRPRRGPAPGRGHCAVGRQPCPGGCLSRRADGRAGHHRHAGGDAVQQGPGGGVPRREGDSEGRERIRGRGVHSRARGGGGPDLRASL